MKNVAQIFGISRDESHVGVVTFSDVAKLSIKLKDHDNPRTFNSAVDAIPLMGSVTRIDRALRAAQEKLFTLKNGARPRTARVLVLLTDGSQTRGSDAEDPADVSNCTVHICLLLLSHNGKPYLLTHEPVNIEIFQWERKKDMIFIFFYFS